MKRLLLTIIISLCFASISKAQTPVLQNQSFAVDYITADIATYSILRFEQKVDTGNYVSINIPPTANDTSTPVGSTTYKTPIPPLTVGVHSIVVRACAAIGCSADSPTLSFKLLIIPVPSGLRIVGDDEFISLIQNELNEFFGMNK